MRARPQYHGTRASASGEPEPVARNQSNSSTNSRYADLARLAESALPIVHKHGFALTFGEVATAKPIRRAGKGGKVAR